MKAQEAQKRAEKFEAALQQIADMDVFLGEFGHAHLIACTALKEGGDMTMKQQETRFIEIMRRHIRDTDADLSDADFVLAVHGRFLKDREVPLIDPNE